MTFDEWVKQDDNGMPRYQRLYNAWYKHDNSELEWQAYYYSLRRAFEAGEKNVL